MANIGSSSSTVQPIGIIRFYSTFGEYGIFSNFAKTPFVLDDKIWPTVEHYFQAMKYYGTVLEEHVRNQPTPTAAKREGRKYQMRTDWENVKISVMRRALYAKFTSFPENSAILMNSYPHILVEHTSADNYWADGCRCSDISTCMCVRLDGSCEYGQNMLGRLLMELRYWLLCNTVQVN